jgi:hypothetical protein
MGRPDFVLFALHRPEGRVTHRGTVTIEGHDFHIDCYLVPTHQEPMPFSDQSVTIFEHYEGTVRKGNPKQKGLFE